MIPGLVVPDIPAEVRGWMVDRLSVPVSVKVPDPRPDSFVTFRDTGGGRDELVAYRATIRYFAWATSLPEARDLAVTVRSALHGMYREQVGSMYVYRVADAAGLSVDPDPESKHARYAGTMAVWVRELADV